MNKIKRELKEFVEYKKKYNFTQKELVEKDGEVYCDGELIMDKDKNVISETDKWIDVGFKNKGDFPKVLSNLFPYSFKFKGKKLASIESFFQGIKYKDKNVQNYVFSYSGTETVHIKKGNKYNWKETGLVYWQGKGIKRDSEEYNLLIDELYISAAQNPIYRGVLCNCEKDIIHSMGGKEKTETTFTRYEFELELNCLKDFLQSKENKTCTR